MTERYFVDQPIEQAASIELSGPEAHHLLHVMRAKVGAEVILFDGSGDQFAARVERLGRSSATLAVLERQSVDRELPFALTLGVALPKGDRQRWLVEKAVELGVTRLVPLITEHSAGHAAADPPQRIRRGVIEAAKQCGRNRLLEIAPAQRLAEFLAAGGASRLLAHPGGSPLRAALAAQDAMNAGAEVRLAVGPEGGFSPGEVESARTAGWMVVDLGPRILRIETAVCFVASAIVGQFG